MRREYWDRTSYTSWHRAFTCARMLIASRALKRRKLNPPKLNSIKREFDRICLYLSRTGLNNKSLPSLCCKNIGGATYLACDQLATHWYSHNESICSYCDTHNYACGTPI